MIEIIITALETLVIIVGVLGFMMDEGRSWLLGWAAVWLALVIISHSLPESMSGVSIPTGLETVFAFVINTVTGLLTYITSHPWKIGLVIGGYLLLGALWSIAKWWFYLHDELERIQGSNTLSYYTNKLKDTALDPKERENAVKNLRSNIPKASENKQEIMTWMAFWPFSVIYSLFHDIVRKVFKRIYQALQEIYDNMAKAVFKDFDIK